LNTTRVDGPAAPSPGLEQLARYVLRPPIAQDRLTRTADGRVLLTPKTEWSDGTMALLCIVSTMASTLRRARDYASPRRLRVVRPAG
jgi:Putative transposase